VTKPIVSLGRIATTAVALLFVLSATAYAQAPADPLPSWNDGPAKQAIIKFVAATTTAGSAEFVANGNRFATFDQDGTLWVEQPIYSQVVFSLDRVVELAPQVVRAQPVGNGQAWAVVRQCKVVVAKRGSRPRHVLDRGPAIRPVGVAVAVATQVA